MSSMHAPPSDMREQEQNFTPNCSEGKSKKVIAQSKQFVKGVGKIKSISKAMQNQAIKQTKNILGTSQLDLNGNVVVSNAMMSFDQSTANIMQCRICLEKIPIIINNLEIAAPCQCQGSIKYVHISCLKQWIQAKGAIQCEICHNLYQQQWIDWAYEQNYLKRSDDTESGLDQPQEEEPDLLEKNCSKIRFFFISLLIISVFIMIYLIFIKEPIQIEILDDPFFLMVRVFIIGLTIATIVVIYKWREKIIQMFMKSRALNNNLQEQVLFLPSYRQLKTIEEKRDLPGIGIGQNETELSTNRKPEDTSRPLRRVL